VSDAEVCAAGTGIDLLDIEICGRAIRSRSAADLSEISRATLHSVRGRAYTRLGELQRAIADFDAAVALNPLSASAYNHRGVVRHAQGNFELAVADYRRAIELFPNYAEAYRNRGFSHFFQGDVERAVADYSTVIELAPWDPEPVVLRALAYYQSGRYAHAAADFERAQRKRYPYKYLALWQYLTAGQSQRDVRNVLLDAASQLDRGEWPEPLIAAYLSQDPAEHAISAARDSPQTVRAVRRSEVNFYLGELALLRNEQERAANLFRASIDAGTAGTVEHLMAGMALSRMHE
jgi:lipoprotein NlpI